MHVGSESLTHKLMYSYSAEVEDTSVSAFAINYITCAEYLSKARNATIY